MKIDMRVLLAAFYSSTDKVFFFNVEKLLGVTHFTMSPIRSSAYIPSIVLLPDAL
jgi:hypothetical protein